MKKIPRRPIRWPSILALIILAVAAAYIVFTWGRPAAVPLKREIFPSVSYRRIVRFLPHPLIAHVLVIDTKNARGISFIVTPPEDVDGGALKARTTSQFLEEFGVQIAVNGDRFQPWWSHSPLDYYPHVGDPVTPRGFSASQGDVYADVSGDGETEPTLYISRSGELTFNDPPNRIFDALSGDRMLIMGGKPIPDLDDTILHPRTAIGVNQNGRWLYLLVVDGRQPFYSTGATYQELADLLIDLGANDGMALDGGGSSTMVIQGEDGGPQILNSPIDNYIPGRERPVANHLGIYLDR